MDIASIVGFILAYVILATGISLGGPFVLFVNAPSLMIVVGGTFAVTLMRVTIANFLGSFKIGLKGFFYKLDAPQNLIDESVELANIARKEGILALEGREIGNGFLERGIGLCIDGHTPEVVKGLLAKDINMSIERHTVGADMFKAMTQKSVNLSAQGIAYYDDQDPEQDELVELRLKLLPSGFRLVIIARVVLVEKDRCQDQGKHRISLDFENLHEADREILIKHMHGKQMESLSSVQET